MNTDTIFWTENPNWELAQVDKNPWPNDYITDVGENDYIHELKLIMQT